MNLFLNKSGSEKKLEVVSINRPKTRIDVSFTRKGVVKTRVNKQIENILGCTI